MKRRRILEIIVILWSIVAVVVFFTTPIGPSYLEGDQP